MWRDAKAGEKSANAGEKCMKASKKVQRVRNIQRVKSAKGYEKVKRVRRLVIRWKGWREGEKGAKTGEKVPRVRWVQRLARRCKGWEVQMLMGRIWRLVRRCKGWEGCKDWWEGAKGEKCTKSEKPWRVKQSSSFHPLHQPSPQWLVKLSLPCIWQWNEWYAKKICPVIEVV